MFRHNRSQRNQSVPDITLHNSILMSHDEIRKGLWYAFDSLSDSTTGTTAISRLKVFTSSIGRALGFDKSEELLNNFALKEIDFKTYFGIIEDNLLKSLDKSSDETLHLAHCDIEQYYNICWTLFYNQHFSHPGGKTYTASENKFYKVWMVFNLLAEDDENGVAIFPPEIHREEVQRFLRAFTVSSGQTSVDLKIQDIANEEGLLTFIDFIDLFMKDFGQHLKDSIFTLAVDSIYETFIDDVLEKGMLCKRGHQVKHWKDRWIVLKPQTLKYYTHSDEKDMKGCIMLHKDCRVEVLPEKSGTKPNRFVLHTNMKPYEMSASDLKARNDWVSALQLAIDNSQSPNFHHHKQQSKERQKKRNVIRKRILEEERKRKEDEETLRRLQEEYNERLQQDELRYQEQLRELEAEKMAREDLEARFLREAALHEVERRRLRELEEMKKELERLLEEERQAKRDEEIVRQLQARLLQEECEKREELERLKKEQEELLVQERQHREGLEGSKLEQERNLLEAQEKLKQLEIDREAANSKLLEASTKLQQAEKDRSIMEAKANLWRRPTVGLARPIQPTVDPMITHRGLGAFCDADFQRLQNQTEQQSKNDNSGDKQTVNLDNDVKKCETENDIGNLHNKLGNDADSQSESRRSDCHSVGDSKSEKSSETDDTKDTNIEITEKHCEIGLRHNTDSGYKTTDENSENNGDDSKENKENQSIISCKLNEKEICNGKIDMETNVDKNELNTDTQSKVDDIEGKGMKSFEDVELKIVE